MIDYAIEDVMNCEDFNEYLPLLCVFADLLEPAKFNSGLGVKRSVISNLSQFIS